MSNIIDYKEAGTLLADALKHERAGFVARIAISREQADFAAGLAYYRRGLARLSLQRGHRDYAAAVTVGAHDLAQLATEKRAMLAEMLVADVLTVARIPFRNQSYVDHRPAAAADLCLYEREYDIKAAGQVSFEWSHGPARDRFSDDSCITINRCSHEHYCASPAFAGYVCVYVYVRNEVPYAADLFVCTVDSVGELRTASIPGVRDMSYYSPALPFPDALRSEDWRARADAARALAAEKGAR